MSEIKVNLENLRDDEREQLLALIEKANKKPKRFKPEVGGIYGFVDGSGDAAFNWYYERPVDLARYNTGNCFATKEEAEFEAEKRKVITELEIFALENNDEIDWENRNREKRYYLCYNHDLNTLEFNWSWNIQNQGVIYFSSRKTCGQAVEKVGADRIKKYLFGIEGGQNDK